MLVGHFLKDCLFAGDSQLGAKHRPEINLVKCLKWLQQILPLSRSAIQLVSLIISFKTDLSPSLREQGRPPHGTNLAPAETAQEESITKLFQAL
jgi:hypothetical protein